MQETSAKLLAEVEQVWPELTYHYGLTFDDLSRMPRWARLIYAKALRRILAEAQLVAVEAASFPYMDKTAQRRMIRQLNMRTGRTAAAAATKPKSLKDVQDAATALGFGVYVDGESVSV